MNKLINWILSLNRVGVNLVLVGLSWLGSALLFMFTQKVRPDGEYEPGSLFFYFILLMYNLMLFWAYLWLDSKRSNDEED